MINSYYSSRLSSRCRKSMKDNKVLSALKAAFPHTLPILAGFIVLGMGYGIYLRSSGLPLWYPTLTSILVFGGSLEFLLVSMLLSTFQPISVFFLSLLVQARHIFYGLTLLKKYRGRGLKSLYLIYLNDMQYQVTNKYNYHHF